MNSKSGICPVCGYVRGGGDSSMLPRGTRLADRYIIGGNIGHGGFGITYLAYDTNNGKTVAVKEYFPTALAKRSGILHVIPNSERNAEQFNTGAEKFFDEAELVRRFNGNPNIVSIYECFYENNTAYYVMEYLDGITLENYVEKYGALNSAQTLYIADKLTMALLVLHSGKAVSCRRLGGLYGHNENGVFAYGTVLSKYGVGYQNGYIFARHAVVFRADG